MNERNARSGFRGLLRGSLVQRDLLTQVQSPDGHLSTHHFVVDHHRSWFQNEVGIPCPLGGDPSMTP